MMKQPKRILCVEDHADTCELLSTMLGVVGYEVRSTSAPSIALRLAQSEHFDCFILDLHLPGKSGLDLCREIRAFNQHTPIIFYSAAAYESDKAMGLQAGAQVYLVKPEGTEVLIETVRRLTSQTSTEGANMNGGPPKGEMDSVARDGALND